LAYVGASSEVVRHGQAVSGIARILASQLNQSGMKLNVKMAETAGLLHDLAKGKKHHARTGGRILKSLGFGPVAWIVSQHMDFEFSAADSINEAAIVYLADKLTREDHYVSVETRFASATMKYPPGHALEPMIMHRMSVAQKIAAAVEQQCGQALSTLISMNNEALEEHTSNVAKF
jgi:HD superfamily phosphohydrolase YqeK